MSFLEILEYSSVFIFALTGALVASRAQLDPVGFLFIAALTAVGGGTVRDLLLDRNPLFVRRQKVWQWAVTSGNKWDCLRMSGKDLILLGKKTTE